MRTEKREGCGATERKGEAAGEELELIIASPGQLRHSEFQCPSGKEGADGPLRWQKTLGLGRKVWLTEDLGSGREGTASQETLGLGRKVRLTRFRPDSWDAVSTPEFSLYS